MSYGTGNIPLISTGNSMSYGIGNIPLISTGNSMSYGIGNIPFIHKNNQSPLASAHWTFKILLHITLNLLVPGRYKHVER
jgi:hypothetical protein